MQKQDIEDHSAIQYLDYKNLFSYLLLLENQLLEKGSS